VLAGVRVEHSEGDITGVELPFENGTFLGVRQFTASNAYTNFLPGVHFRFEPAKDWLVRAAWTNTIGRPNYPDIAASRSFSFAEDVVGSGVYTGSVSQGNPDLEPYESMNFDLSVERYLANSGILSAGVFHKRIDNPIFTNAYTLRNTTYEGLNFSSLGFSRPENAESGKITGLELNYQQQLTMLPSPFNGLGFSVNYTLTDSEEKLFSRPNETLPFAKQADRIYNVALFYEKYRWQARVAYTYTGDFIKAFGSDINSDQYQAERKIIDAKVSFRLTKHLSVFADIINLGEEPLDEYAGYPNRNGATEAYWWTANFGINWQL
jgi:TonB-dependent receptor